MPNEVIDRRETPLGEVVLRRRRVAGADEPVYEALLDGAFLMSSLVTESERRLAESTLASVEGDALEVLVGGLGLGYAVAAALDENRVRSVVAVERLGAVIAWRRGGRLPLSRRILGDARCTVVEDDFFSREDGRSFDAILVDIDHSPRAHLDPAHAAFYGASGLAGLRARVRGGGAFGLWSGDVPDAGFLRVFERVFTDARAEVVRFRNPLADCDEVNTIYVGRR